MRPSWGPRANGVASRLSLRVVCPCATGSFQPTCDLEVRPRCHAERNVLRFRGRTASGRTCRDPAWLIRCSPLAAGQRPPSGGCDPGCRERQRFGGRLRCPRLRCSVSRSHRGSWLPTSSPLSFPLISRDGRHPDACEMLDATPGGRGCSRGCPWVWGADARGVQAFGPLCPPRGRALLWGQPHPSREPSASAPPQLQAAVLVHPSSSTPVHVLPRQACSGRGRTGCPARVPSGEQVLSYLPLRSQRLGRGPQGCQCGCELCPLGVTEPWKVDWGGAGTPINSTPLKSLPSLRLLGQGRATQLRRPSPARPWVVYSSQSQNLGL